jgi:hypothetical protein
MNIEISMTQNGKKVKGVKRNVELDESILDLFGNPAGSLTSPAFCGLKS